VTPPPETAVERRPLLARPIEGLGRFLMNLLSEFGAHLFLFFRALRNCFWPPFRIRLILRQMELVGVNSIPVVLITGGFTGAVLALQTFTSFKRFNAETMIGGVIAVTLLREMGPVLTGLIVAGRAGSAMAAEIGTMNVTEQIDALNALATDPVNYLVVPRFLAGTFMMPMLSTLFSAIGMIGSYVISVSVLGTNPVTYMRQMWWFIEGEDIYTGLIKAAVFGIIISIIGSYQGFITQGGAEGVGRSTTRAVVLASTFILIFNYILTALLL
jgi:phospholipid/cholesterol/gamma-HCH transport system permease protein